MAVFLGRNAAIGIAEEATWGTPLSRTQWSTIRSSTLAKKEDWASVPDLGGGNASIVAESFFQVSEDVSGSVEMNANYDSYLLTGLLKHAMGAVTDGGTTGVYTHTYTLAAALYVGLTVEIVKGTGHGEVYEGCRVGKLTLACAVGEVMRLSVDLIGQTSAALVSAATASIPAAPRYVMHHNGGTLTINAIPYTIKSMELVIDNKLARREQLGSLDTLDPERTDKPEVSIRCTLERISSAIEACHQAGTQANATITWTGGTGVMAITLHNAVVVSYDCPISRVGVLEETIELRGFRSSGSTGLEIVVTNVNAAAMV